MHSKASFLICGAQKAGTTALADYLRQHREINIPEQKELHYFDNESINWTRPNYTQYHKQFEPSERKILKGEATPIYMYWEPCAERIWKYNPQIKLIIILRNPITRAYSHWSMEKRRGAETLNFRRALANELQRSFEALPWQDRIGSYVDRGYYCSQLRRLWRFFGRDALLILKQEELLNDHQRCLNKVCSHLGISQMQNVPAVFSHEGNYPEPMDPEIYGHLRVVFWHEICQLEALLGWDCSAWLKS